MAEENFLANPDTEAGRLKDHFKDRRFWPGLKEMELPGVGTVNVGYGISPEGKNQPALADFFSETDRNFVKREISYHKVVAFMEVEERFLAKLRYIMDTHDALLVEPAMES